MKQTSETADHKTRVMESIAGFLTRFRRPILVTLITIAVLVVGLIVFLSIQNSRAERALESVETLTDTYREWLATVDTADPGAAADEFESIETSAMELIERYTGTYAATRARMITAEGHYELGNWTESAEGFVAVAEETEGTYLNVVALMAAGVSFENAGDQDAAVDRYREISETDDLGYGFAPRALFSVGRIEESRGQVVAAAEAYQTLIDDYPTSSWTNLARNRIITLTVQGRIGE